MPCQIIGCAWFLGPPGGAGSPKAVEGGEKCRRAVVQEGDRRCGGGSSPGMGHQDKQPPLDLIGVSPSEPPKGGGAAAAEEPEDLEQCKQHSGTQARYPLVLQLALWALLATYVIVACRTDFRRACPVLVISAGAFWVWLLRRLREECSFRPEVYWTSLLSEVQKHPRLVQGLQVFAAGIFPSYWLVMDARRDPGRLVPLLGLLLFLAGTYATSRHRSEVRWRPVIGGVALQFALGMVIMRTRPGFEFFRWLGVLAAGFIDHVDSACAFVFGEQYKMFFLVFKVLPIIIYFGSVVAVGYYTGWAQFLFVQVSRVVQVLMGTSAAESFVAAANIFIGQTEAPLLIRPFLKDLTMSELHAVMASGFATIAGSVLAAYISFGVNAEHLIAASVMSCPAALAMAKLSYPETEKPRALGSVDDVARAAGKDPSRNVLDAATNGAIAAAYMVACITACLIAFLSIWSLLDGILVIAGELVGVQGFDASLICSYVFWPVAFVMGVPASDCRQVARLLGEKTFLNEFVAYLNMSKIVAAGGLSHRSQAIATFALCGFSNIGSIGIQLGGLGSLCPERRRDMADVVIRAMIIGNVACFMTACIAGMLYEEP